MFLRSWMLPCALCAVCCGVCDLGASLLAPFYPDVLLKTYNGTHAQVGAVFGASALPGVLLTPFTIPLMARTGPRALLCSTVVLQGACIAAFSFLHLLPPSSTTPFVAASVALRLVQGSAAACTETAAGSIILRAAPDEAAPRSRRVDGSGPFPEPSRNLLLKAAGSALGVVEALRGVGSLLGPLLGGFLYDTGGFALPFQVAGGTAALIGVGGFALLPRSSAGEAPGRSASIARLLRIPAVFAGSAVMVSVAMIAISFLDPTLQPHLAQPPYRLQPTSVGALFTLSMVGYILASLASGPLARRVGDVKQLCAGVWCLALAYLLLGPSPLLPALRPSFPLAATAMLLIGAGGAVAYTPTNNLSLRACEARGIAVNEASAALTAIVNMSFTVGCLIGPSLGGSLVQAAGFGGASTALGAHPAHPPACAPPPAPTPSALAGLMLAALPFALLPCVLQRAGRSPAADGLAPLHVDAPLAVGTQQAPPQVPPQALPQQADRSSGGGRAALLANEVGSTV